MSSAFLLEAARGDDHVRRADLLDALRRLEDHAGDLAVLDDQVDATVLGLRLNAAIQQGLEQPAAERQAHPALVVVDAALHLLRRDLVRHGLAERGLADGQVVGRVVRRDVNAVLPLAQLAIGEERGLERPAALAHGADLLGVVVREVGQGVELHRRPVVQVNDHLGAAVDVGLDHRVGRRPVRDRLEVRDRLLARVALLLRLVLVERDPDHPARVDRRAADGLVLLEHADAGAFLGGHYGGRQGRSARAEHDDVVVVYGPASPGRNRTNFSSKGIVGSWVCQRRREERVSEWRTGC